MKPLIETSKILEHTIFIGILNIMLHQTCEKTKHHHSCFHCIKNPKNSTHPIPWIMEMVCQSRDGYLSDIERD